MKVKKPGVFIAADNVFTPLGKTTDENFSNLLNNRSAVMQHSKPALSAEIFSASLFDEGAVILNDPSDHTKFEQLLIASVRGALNNAGISPNNEKTILIVSSTKGNISLLENEVFTPALQRRISLSASAKKVQDHFGFLHTPLVISNACISGVVAIITAMRLLQAGKFENAVVTGADVISKFVITGFQSFKALSAVPCKPFDIQRGGINLGEGAATVILSSNHKYTGNIQVTGGGISNDANHISGPSRTGQELAGAIHTALTGSGLTASAIDVISAHGTATVFNDEMEANALNLAGLNHVPLTGLKGYYGHTLGAAGIIEAVIAAEAMRRDTILPTAGFETAGTKHNHIYNTSRKAGLKTCLKTASGFGGCNAAVVLSK